MNSSLMTRVTSDWARLGVMFNVVASGNTPDLEALLLNSARVASQNSRVLVLAASWLTHYGECVAKHRLARMILDDLEPDYRPVLGLLLDSVKERSTQHDTRFKLAINACGAPHEARPLSDVEYQNPSLAKMALERATPLSKKWGRWMSAFEPKDNAIRPASWIAQHNPELYERALTGGDLLSSILLECQSDPRPIESEAELARRCGASRPAVRQALRRLVLAGRICTLENGRMNAVKLIGRANRSSPP